MHIKILDQIRGIAFILMLIHHIHYFKDVGNKYKTSYAKNIIISNIGKISRYTFILLVGISLYNSYRNNKSKFIKSRVKKSYEIFLHACLITCITKIIYPEFPIYFGVLHFISIGSLLAIPFVDKPVISIIIAYLLIIYLNPIKNNLNSMNMPYSINTMLGNNYYQAMIDYFPILGWLPILLIGIFIGHILDNSSLKLLRNNSKFGYYLEKLGQNSLVIYTTHLIFLLIILKKI